MPTTLSATQVTLRILLQPGASEEIAVVTFDDGRVSAAEIKRWMLLHENGYYSEPRTSYYAKCKTDVLTRLKKDIRTTKWIISELDPTAYPAELKDVVLYLKDTQSFWLWQAQQELSFLEAGTISIAYGQINLASCQVPDLSNRSEACHQVFATWHNCSLGLVKKRLGDYPRKQWQAFLGIYGIKERLLSTVD